MGTQARPLTHVLEVALIQRSRRAHGVGLAGTGLAICEERDIVSLRECIDAVGQVLPDALLIDLGTENAVEHEDLSALWCINGHAGVRLEIDHGSLESLG